MMMDYTFIAFVMVSMYAAANWIIAFMIAKHSETVKRHLSESDRQTLHILAAALPFSAYLGSSIYISASFTVWVPLLALIVASSIRKQNQQAKPR